VEIREGKLVIRVRLGGRRISVVEDALIDTGSTFTVLPPEIVDYLELQRFRNLPRVKLTTASGFMEVPLRLLNYIEIGAIKLENVPVVVHRIPDPAPIKILIGMNLLEKAKLEVDGKAGKFEIGDP